MTTLLIATRNTHKVQEISQILSTRFRYLTLRDFPDAPAVIEDADTFEGNARKKALELARWIGAHPELRPPAADDRDFHILADDSGLEVDALNGEPGVRSARFASGAGESAGNSPGKFQTDGIVRLVRHALSIPSNYCLRMA